MSVPKRAPLAEPVDPNGCSTAVVIQPFFFPWRGQFDLMSRADTVIFLDTVQYPRNSWCNRNRIATASGEQWITVPVKSSGSLATPIHAIEIANDKPWQRKLFGAVDQAYGKARCYRQYRDGFRALITAEWHLIAALARASVEWTFDRLGRRPTFINASELGVVESDAVLRVVRLCRAVGARRYLSGPAARDYITSDRLFRDHDLELLWMSYNYPAYPQRYSSAIPLSVLDLLFNAGDEAHRYIWPQSE